MTRHARCFLRFPASPGLCSVAMSSPLAWMILANPYMILKGIDEACCTSSSDGEDCSLWSLRAQQTHSTHSERSRWSR